MDRQLCAALAVALAATGGVGATEARTDSPAPGEVTADIQAGIEKHIEQCERAGGGRFRLPFGERELSLVLVRVHTEYLAKLGAQKYFACVDLADTSGDVYDVDFFLAGEPGAMEVVETSVHKLNGQPFYAWQQAPDGTWRRVEMATAQPCLLGVVNGRDEFEFTYNVTLPEIVQPARMWLPLAQSDAFQTVEVRSIDSPGERRVLEEPDHGNKVLFLELGPADSGAQVEIRYHVRRLEKAAYAGAAGDAARYLAPERLVPVDESFRALAEPIVAGKTTDLTRARALYDHVIDRMRYMKHGSGWGCGDAVRACNARTGNCSDFHAYFIGLARAVGVPARFAIGAAIPSERNDGGIDGYHCWVEFFDRAGGKWWPVDISEADKYSALSTYYFGHHPANRLELSRGRDLVVEPGPASGPINFLAYPVLEIAGKPAPTKVRFWFRRAAGVASAGD